MGTCNFHKQLASAYFVVQDRRFFNSEGEEINEWEDGCEEEDFTEDLLDSILYQAEEDGWEKSDRRVGRDDWGLCEKWEHKDLILGTTTFEIKTEIIVRPGYYEACNLDWDIRVRVPGSGFDVRVGDYDSIEDLAEDIFDAFMWYEDEWNEGIKKMQKKNIIKKALDRIREVGLNADKFCEEHCTGKYGIYAQFSNGETWYTQIA